VSEAPPVSVIVRARNEAARIERALESVRAQTRPAELIVVDSGSTDGTVEIARRWCDELIELPAGSFTYGRALNIGAARATAPIHVALSAHCVLDRADWLARALVLYERGDVAGVNGMTGLPDGAPARCDEPYHQRVQDVLANPGWGFSNHASSWRAEAWERHPFDEELGYAEDKEWAWRVLRAGWTIAFSRELYVDMSHQWRDGFGQLLRRDYLSARAIASFVPAAPYRLGDLRRDWWHELPEGRHSALTYRFLDPRRFARLGIRYVARRQGARLCVRR
jgi:rhamnosyltransferase